MIATPATAVRQIATARVVNRVQPNRLAYSTTTGQVKVEPVCAMVKRHGEHVLVNVEADLPGDRSVGTCSCGKWIDTGTWDERNA